MTIPDELARTVIQHFVVHDGEVGDIVWPLPEARRVVELWLRAAGDAVTRRHRTASEARAADWKVFDTDPADPRPLFVVVDGIAPASPELSDAIAAASEGVAQPVLLLEDRPDDPLTDRLDTAGWRFTDARELQAADPGPRAAQ